MQERDAKAADPKFQAWAASTAEEIERLRVLAMGHQPAAEGAHR